MCNPCWDLDTEVLDTLLTVPLDCRTIFDTFLSIGIQHSAGLGVLVVWRGQQT